jgi:hypothetical protein
MLHAAFRAGRSKAKLASLSWRLRRSERKRGVGLEYLDLPAARLMKNGIEETDHGKQVLSRYSTIETWEALKTNALERGRSRCHCSIFSHLIGCTDGVPLCPDWLHRCFAVLRCGSPDCCAGAEGCGQVRGHATRALY